SRTACSHARMAHLRPGQDTCPRRRWAQVPDHRYPLMINGVPVVEAPEEIDICDAEQLRIVLLEAASRGHATIVVDMARTRFCDSSGFSVLVAAHQRALAGVPQIFRTGDPIGFSPERTGSSAGETEALHSGVQGAGRQESGRLLAAANDRRGGAGTQYQRYHARVLG